MSNPFDSVPSGKKPKYTIEKGWHLVNLDSNNLEDVIIMYNENKAKLKKNKAQLEKLTEENKILKKDLANLDVKNQELTLTLNGLKKGKK